MVCGAVDLIDVFKSGTTHMLQSTQFCIRRVVTQCKSYNGKLFFRGYGKGKVKGRHSAAKLSLVVVNIEISLM